MFFGTQKGLPRLSVETFVTNVRIFFVHINVHANFLLKESEKYELCTTEVLYSVNLMSLFTFQLVYHCYLQSSIL